MISPSSASSTDTNENQPGATPPKIPRIESLQHQLQRAKDSDGQPIPLFDELFFLLDAPPPGTGDRWQKGADLCAEHGIKTSRMSVWRLYRGHILQWRREQNPAPAAPPPSPAEIAQLHEQVTHLAAQRTLESLNDPRLSPGHLIGLVQNDNHRRQIQLDRDQFNDRLAVRHRQERREHFKRIDDEMFAEEFIPRFWKFKREFVTLLIERNNERNNTTS